VAVRLAEGDARIAALAGRSDSAFNEFVRERRRMVAEAHAWPEESVFSLHRHAVAVGLAETVSRVERRPGRSARERLDDWATHPVLGLLVAVAVLAGLFGASFLAGNGLASLLSLPMDAASQAVRGWAGDGLPGALVRGVFEGIAGGAGIVLPYLLPLLLILALLEDSGYLPRAAFLLDGLMHRIGLHGKSVIPLVLGYGCNVPALMVTRILESRRDRVITGLLVPLVPCSARTVVILALVAGILGPLWAVGVYVLNLLIAAGVGRVLARLSRSDDAGLVMDIPPWRVPPLRAVAHKVWLRTREFLVSAWPIILVASVVMAVLEWAGVGDWMNRLLAPLTSGVLGLPAVLGVTLVFGVLRKELALVLLYAALGTEDVASVLTPAQILGFSLFVTFYVPCVATVTTLGRELGWRWAGVSVALNTGLAIAVAAAARLL
jgi:ferrous iron transport protein B